MGKVIFSHNDLKGHIESKPTLKLSAVVGADSFFYSISDPKGDRSCIRYWQFKNKWLPFSNPFSHMPDIFREEKMLFHPFSEVSLAFFETEFMLLPNQLLRHSNAADLADRFLAVPAGDRVFALPVSDGQHTLLFSVAEKLIAETGLYFSRFRFLHLAYCLIEYQLRTVAAGHSCMLYLNMDSMILIIASVGKIIFSKRFTVRSTSDILYFCHAILQSLGIERGDIKISLCGPSAVDGQLELLKLYYPQTAFVPDGVEPQPIPLFKTLDLHSLRVCGS